MKKLSLILLVCLSALLLNSCKKSATDGPSTNYFMTFKLDGIDQSAATINANNIIIKSGTTTIPSQLTMLGSVGSYGGVIIVFSNDIKPGIYSFSSGSNTGGIIDLGYQDGPTALNGYTGLTGTVIITALTTTSIAGTFEFTCINYNSTGGTTKRITEGKFNSPITTTVVTR